MFCFTIFSIKPRIIILPKNNQMSQMCNLIRATYGIVKQHKPTVDENIISTTKIRNSYVPSNYSFLQYCDSNIALFSIAPCKVIALYLLCFHFGISSVLLFLLLSLSLKLSLFQLSR